MNTPEERAFDWETLTHVPTAEEVAREAAAVAEALRLLAPCERCGRRACRQCPREEQQ